MSKNLNVGRLLDFYGDLLTQKQYAAVDMYYNDDFSLAEVADENNISRQGAYDLIHRAEALLCDYEDKLGLLRKFAKIKADTDKISGYVNDIEKLLPKCDEIGKIRRSLSEISDEL